MSAYQVRRATPEDAEAFTHCQVECWREAYADLWGPEQFAGLDESKLAARRRTELEAATLVHVIAELEGEIVGIAIAGPSRDESPAADLELYASYLRKAHHGSGVADDLLVAALGEGPASLWVYRDNARASAFYVHHDFIPDGSEQLDSAGILEIRMVRR